MRHVRIAFASSTARRAAIACGVVIPVVGAGIAYASIPDSGTSVFHGCYSTTDGALRLVDPSSGGTCDAGENAVSWQQRGVNWRGAWSNASTYSANDAVEYQ